MFESFDKGATFNPQELNAAGTLPMFGKTQSISAVAFGPTSDVIYAAFGCSYNGTTDTLSGGGFLRSTDGGDRWELMSTVPQTWGSNQADEQTGATTEHPRSTGKLIAHNTTNNLFIGTFRDGVMRSTVADGGANWEEAGASGGALGGKFIRGICVPYTASRANVMLVAAWDGCYLSTNINTATAANIAFTKQTDAPAKVEEIVYLGRRRSILRRLQRQRRISSHLQRWQRRHRDHLDQDRRHKRAGLFPLGFHRRLRQRLERDPLHWLRCRQRRRQR